jgi:uncharacterized protein (DUF1330 family)
MAVYFIAQVEVHDRAGYDRYAQQAAGAPAKGMKVLAFDDAPKVIEGKWHGPRTILLEFESEDAFRAWYYSPAYQEAVKLRWAATTSNVVVVKGAG